jgi:hypothetical protein
VLAYSAPALAAAARGPVIEIGGRTFRARPLSIQHHLAVQAAMQGGTLADRVLATLGVLEGAFPPPRRRLVRLWRRLRRRDPVRAIAALPHDLQDRVVRALLRVPGLEAPEEGADDPAAALDPVEATRRLHRQMEAPYQKRRSGGGVSLARAALACERKLGGAWLYNPDRWPTTDGYAPAGVVLLTFVGLQAVAAEERLDATAAASVARGGKHAQRTLDRWQRAAFPPEAP